MDDLYKVLSCVWCMRELPAFPASVPFIAAGDKAICMRCVTHLHRIVADQASRGRLVGEELTDIGLSYREVDAALRAGDGR